MSLIGLCHSVFATRIIARARTYRAWAYIDRSTPYWWMALNTAHKLLYQSWKYMSRQKLSLAVCKRYPLISTVDVVNLNNNKALQGTQVHGLVDDLLSVTMNSQPWRLIK